MTDVLSIDPRTGRPVAMVAQETRAAEVANECARAQEAFPELDAMGRGGRSRLLRGLADALETHRHAVVELADRETALGPTRLDGELTRTCYQLRLFAEVLDEGSYLEAVVDHAGESPMGPRPDLRRMLVPIGPVAVFGASNFPLAFSVPGGDTAAALAAGCPVVVKAHHSHPATSQLCYQILVNACADLGAPKGTVTLVHGIEAGAALVADPVVRAVGFTGSRTGGTALLRIIEARPEPIPFFGELSSLNPIVVTPSAARERAQEVASGIVGSFTLGAGQFCTKPGLVFVPDGPSGESLVGKMAAEVSRTDAAWLLNKGIADIYAEEIARLCELPGVAVAARGRESDGQGYRAVPTLLTAFAANMPREFTEECFGPVAAIIRYPNEAELLSALDRTPASLTVSVLRGEGEKGLPARVMQLCHQRAGRFVFDGYPTGVSVAWAQHHGGPWPATNSQHTSVGATAIRRFLRPITWQDAPTDLLPEELRDDYLDIPRRVDGVLRLARGDSDGNWQ